MANNADNTAIVPDGILYIGAVGAAAPTSSAFVPSTGYTELGYYSEDGYSLTPNAPSTTDLIAHNGDIVQSTTDGNGSWGLQFGPIETKQVTVESYFDATVDLSEGSVEVSSAAINTYRSVIAIALPKDGRRIVKHFPKVKVSDRDGLTFNRSTLILFGMTFQTYKDATTGYQFKIFDPLYLNS
jgi:hypothetical protein